MAIDFTLPPDVEEIRQRVREFIESEVRPVEEKLARTAPSRADVRTAIIEMRQKAQGVAACGCRTCRRSGAAWASGHVAHGRGVGRGGPHAGIGPVRPQRQAPDEGNMHTLLHWGTDEQKEKYLRPLCEGYAPLAASR